MYCFHNVEDYQNMVVYEGNNNADGAYGYTGFRPQWIYVKKFRH